MSLFPCPHILTMNTFFSEEKGGRGYYVQNIVLSTVWIILFHSQSTLRKKIVSHFAHEEAETMQNLCKWLDSDIVSGLTDPGFSSAIY